MYRTLVPDKLLSRTLFLVGVLTWLLLGVSVGAWAQTYTFTTIDPPSTSSLSIALDINNAGVIVGEFRDSSTIHGFVFSNGNFTTLHFPGAPDSAAYGINDTGQIVGTASGVGGFLYSGGSFTPINVPGAFSTIPFAINDAGEIVGNFSVATGKPGRDAFELHGFLFSGGRFTTLDFPGSIATAITGINNAGQLVGWFASASGTHGFVFSEGDFTTVDPPGSVYTLLRGINNAGEIVGIFLTEPLGPVQGFVFSKGSFTPFPEVPSSFYSELFGINDAGEIVGLFDDASRRHGFLATPAPPFATFTATLKLKFGPRVNDAFDLESKFALGAASNGIDPLTDNVTLELTGGTGTFTTTIPAGSFTKDKKGRFTFKGTVEGVKLDATLTPLGGQRYAFTAEGKHADLSGIANPVTITLTIGDDSGSTTVTAHFKHPHDGPTELTLR